MISLDNEIQANDWIYVGEGNQNLVVRYIGQLPAFTGKVLRVIKSNSKNKHIDEKALLSQKEFIDRVVRPLLGEEYVIDMQPISTSVSFLTQLAANVQSARPAQRLSTNIITDAPISFIMADLTHIWIGSPTLTFELKPKWGFKPSKESVTDIKHMYCRYCMHSHLNGVLLNGYCPMDLYSEDPTLVHKALDVLLNKSPIEKTLKVSINGSHTSLTKDDPDSKFKALMGIDSNELLLFQILKHILLHDPILRKLKTLQANLDELDVENILPLYQQQSGNVETDVNSFAHVVDNYQERLVHTDTPITDKQRVLEYVLSMTFKDCSIMINVVFAKQDARPSCNQITLGNGMAILYDIKVIDIDAKKIDKIPYWHELDRSIVKHAIDTSFSKESPCQ